jgi:hypothetical protein
VEAEGEGIKLNKAQRMVHSVVPLFLFPSCLPWTQGKHNHLATPL